MKTSLVALSVAFHFFAGALVAAPLLTPEIAAAPPGLAPAAYEQQEPMVASDGYGFAAIWIDQRAQHPNGRGDLFAVHLDEQGGLLDPRGTRLAEAVVSAQVIAVPAGGYAVAAQTLDVLRFLRLDGEGALLGQPMTVATSDLLFRFGNGLASNGTSYLLTGFTGDGQTMSGLLLDLSGQRKAVVGFSGQVPDGKVTILVIGGRYHALHRNYSCAGNNTPCTSAIVDDVIGDDGVATPRALTTDLGQHYTLGAATSGDRILLAWLSDEAVSQVGGQQTLDYTILDPNGAVIAPRRRIFTTSTSSISGFLEPTVGWDGRNFLLTWQPYENRQPWPSTRLATRITPGGVQLDAAFAIDRGFAGAPRFAHSSGAVATVWAAQPSFSDYGNAVARVTPSFDSLVTATATAPLISLSPTAEGQPAVAVIGDRMLTVWREGDALGVIRASVSRDAGASTGVFEVSSASAGDQHDPAVARATMGGIALITWTEERAGGFRIRARRYSMALDRFLDDAPLLIADQTFPPDGSVGPAGEQTAVATNGAAFFVIWTFADRIQGARIAADGHPLDAAPIVVAHESISFFHLPAISPRVIWTGSHYLVVWVENRSPNVLISPVLPASGVVSARVTAEGVALDADAPLQLWDGVGAIPALTLVAGSGHSFVAWLRTPLGGTQCLETLTLQADTLLASAAPVARLCDTDRNLSGLAAAWNGGGVTLVWSKGTFTRGLFSLRLDANGEPIDSSPTELLPATSDTYSPSLAPSPSGVALTYVRVPLEPQYGFLGRVFTRTILEPAAIHRRLAR